MPKQKSNLPYKRTGAYRQNLKKYKEDGVPTLKLTPEIIYQSIETMQRNEVHPVPCENLPGKSSQFSHSESKTDNITVESVESSFDRESMDEGEEQLEKCLIFKEKLRNWALVHKIPHTALNDLINIIKSSTEIVNLPKDSRTLLERPRKIEVVHMGPEPDGLFWYQGLQKCFDSIPSVVEPIKNSELNLSFNIDGLPIYKSSKYEFWPILAKIEEIPELSPLVLAIYYGKCKPDLKSFLQDFVEDVSRSITNGIKVGDRLISIKIRCFICDTPARAFIKGTVNFNHRHGCARCTVEGEFFKEGHHISFHRHNASLRTNSSFRQRLDEDHHKEKSPLETLPIDMVADFIVADPLHLLDLGIMKKCLTGWVHGSFNFKTKLSANAISEISNLLLSFNKNLPVEIHRAVRGLDCLRFWKGLEYRTFILYLGPVVLKDFLSPEVYLHFLNFFCAVTICSSNVYSKYLDIAKDLFIDYVEDFIDIYGKDSIGSNVHNLIHVVDDVKRFGPLGTISTYPFENKLFLIKSLLRGGKSPLQQVAMRLSEYSKLTCKSDSKNLVYPSVAGCRKSLVDSNLFNQVNVREGFSLRSDKKNKWFLTKKSEIVSMEYGMYSDKIYIYGKALKEKHPLFDINPINSLYINIFRASGELFNNRKPYYIEDIECKLVSLEYQDSLIFFPLIHTLITEN